MSTLTAYATTGKESGAAITAGGRTFDLEYSDAPGRQVPCPVELIAMGLAGCVSLTIRSVAEARNFPLENAEVRVSTSPDYGRPTRTEHSVDIVLHGPLSAKERIILLRSARACHVHKVLGGENTFAFTSEGQPF